MSEAVPESLPWRGPGPGRPEELPLPPDKLPVRRGGRWRKQWRYVAAFAEELMVCAARVRVGPLGQTFWAVCERESDGMWERTRIMLPGARGEVWTEHATGEGEGEEVVPELGDLGVLDYAPDEGSLVRIDGRDGAGESVRAFLRCGKGRWMECVCPTSDGEYVWTRKRADVPIECDVRIGGRRWRVAARGVEDESAGYHPRHTVWSWSAGVGQASDGRSVGWNLVSGINDPHERSERAIWLDGEPSEPEPVEFEQLHAIRFAGGERLEFSPDCERRKAQNLGLVRYTYRQPFGSFTGTLPGGIELAHGLGVMEHHDAVW